MSTVNEEWEAHKRTLGHYWDALPKEERHRTRAREYQRWLRTHPAKADKVRVHHRDNARENRKKLNAEKRAAKERLREHMVEDVEWLVGWVLPRHIVPRVTNPESGEPFETVGSLEQALRRAGRADLAAYFDPDRREETRRRAMELSA